MELILENVTFTNDFFFVRTPDGNTLVLNKIDESLKIDDVDNFSLDIKNINIEIVTMDSEYIPCPCVIGMKNDYISINTNYKEYEGEVLTSENMKYCTITVYES